MVQLEEKNDIISEAKELFRKGSVFCLSKLCSIFPKSPHIYRVFWAYYVGKEEWHCELCKISLDNLKEHFQLYFTILAD